MRLKVIGCEVLARELYRCAGMSPRVVDIELVPKGLHETPAVLREEIRRRTEAVPAEAYEAIALAYGLCSNSLAGLRAGKLPLVLPRAHDCITLYLGSRQRYLAEFEANPGTYYFTTSYMERGGELDGKALGSGGPVKGSFEELAAKYGEDNARYLMEVQGSWTKHYSRAAFIDTGLVEGNSHKALAQEKARENGWRYEELEGNLRLLRRLLDGEWDTEEYLIVRPGEEIVPSYDGRVVSCRVEKPSRDSPLALFLLPH